MLFYTHVNEDNAVERAALASAGARELVVVAGSGERVLALLDQPGLSDAWILDNNPHALYLCALKIEALKQLSWQHYLAFTGVEPATPQWRCQLFEQIAPALTPACCAYWQTQREAIEIGVCNSGHFERFLARARPLLRFFLGNGFYQCLKKPKAAWRGFPYWRWALVRKLFSWRGTYWLFGMRDPAFLSKNAALHAIPQAMQDCLNQDRVQQSCLFHLVMNGHLRDMPPENLPPSFQPEVLQRTKAALLNGSLRLHYLEGDAQELLEQTVFAADCRRFFSLSDLLSFFDWDKMDALLQQISNIGNGRNRVLFRTFVRHRMPPEHLMTLRHKWGRVSDLSAEERTRFYQVFQIDYNENT